MILCDEIHFWETAILLVQVYKDIPCPSSIAPRTCSLRHQYKHHGDTGKFYRSETSHPVYHLYRPAHCRQDWRYIYYSCRGSLQIQIASIDLSLIHISEPTRLL